MRLSRRSEYGIRALVDLIRQDEARPMALASLAQRNRLPPKFLEQILSTLKRGGIVRTTLGAHGGGTPGGGPPPPPPRPDHPAPPRGPRPPPPPPPPPPHPR